MELDIHVTKNAMDYILAMQKENSGKHFRLSIKKTGCSGYAYAPSLVADILPNDFPLMVDQLTLYIDPLWAHVMQGLQIDYVEENKSGLKQKKLIFTNPNEAARCGCGESFHLE